MEPRHSTIMFYIIALCNIKINNYINRANLPMLFENKNMMHNIKNIQMYHKIREQYYFSVQLFQFGNEWQKMRLVLFICSILPIHFLNHR